MWQFWYLQMNNITSLHKINHRFKLRIKLFNYSLSSLLLCLTPKPLDTRDAETLVVM
jgi:hypothetical protein